MDGPGCEFTHSVRFSVSSLFAFCLFPSSMFHLGMDSIHRDHRCSLPDRGEKHTEVLGLMFVDCTKENEVMVIRGGK